MKTVIIIVSSVLLGASLQYRYDLYTVRSILRSTAGSLTENIEQANALLDIAQQR